MKNANWTEKIWKKRKILKRDILANFGLSCRTGYWKRTRFEEDPIQGPELAGPEDEEQRRHPLETQGNRHWRPLPAHSHCRGSVRRDLEGQVAEKRHRGQNPGRARVHSSHLEGLQRRIPQIKVKTPSIIQNVLFPTGTI